MSRDITLTAKQAIFSQESSEVFLILLTIDHVDLADPIRVVRNTKNIDSRGDTYVGLPFDVDMPEERDDRLGHVTLTIDNVDRKIVTAIRSLTSAPSVTMEIILASDLNTLEAGPFPFTLRDTEWDSLTVTGVLSFEDVLNEPYPGDSFTPATHPGLF